MNSETVIRRMRAVALEILLRDPSGGLQTFVVDGNCSDKNLKAMLAKPDLTRDERSFVERILADLSEEARKGALALAQCDDIVAAAEQLRRLDEQ